MNDARRTLIKSFTQESLDKCTDNLKSNFELIKKDLVHDLMCGVRLDIFDKLNENLNDDEYKTYTRDEIKKEFLLIIKEIPYFDIHGIDKKIEELLSVITLKKNEHYVHYVCYCSHKKIKILRQHSQPSNDNNNIVSFGIISNLSNFIWLEINSKSTYCEPETEQNNIKKISFEPYKKHILNTPLHCMYINVLSSTKLLSPQIFPIEGIEKQNHDMYQWETHVVKNKNIWKKTTRPFGTDYGAVTNHTDVYDMIVKILDLNKKYSVQMLIESDLQKKYDLMIKKNEEMQKSKEVLEEKIKYLQNELIEAIPEQNRCCICFGYTHKKKACVPCGHMQYCDKCIGALKECALCKTKVGSVINLFGV